MSNQSGHDWNRRQEAIVLLRQDGGLGVAELIEEGFAVLDSVLAELDLETGGSFERVCALTICKARRFALGSYSLMLDGLGQEAGALMRPLLECLEMLSYFVDDPDRVDGAIDGELPRAGNIAQEIDGRLKFLRDYWSEHASHFGFTIEATGHLIDFKSHEVRPVDPLSHENLQHNTTFILLFLWMLSIESVNALGKAGREYDDIPDLVDRAERYRRIVAASADIIREAEEAGEEP